MDKKLVMVKWVDASDPVKDMSWFSDKDVDEFSADVCEVVSIGWIKSDTKLYKTLVSDYIHNADGTYTWGRPTKIPQGMITSVEILTELHDEISLDPATRI